MPGQSGGAVVDIHGRLVSVAQGMIVTSLGSALAYGSWQGELQAFIAPYLP
jgi:hypothetical protein